jgi:[1-hydroxy-2-(trimethylamino)ethyl]phosphonate dioxygenase
MTRLASLDEIERLYAERGGLSYGEGVTQTEHAVQTAVLAQESGAAPSMVIAALLHDVGHLFVSEEDAVRTDDRHEARGAAALSGLFGDAVCGPIALHVAAKRYLCFKEPGYLAGLSPASQASLKLQGGAFDARGAAEFEQRPYWREAVALRRCDDTGKREDALVRAFADFTPMMLALLKT